jgi:hypothetical protein
MLLEKGKAGSGAIKGYYFAGRHVCVNKADPVCVFEETFF